jgi:hypothetical protein
MKSQGGNMEGFIAAFFFLLGMISQNFMQFFLMLVQFFGGLPTPP